MTQINIFDIPLYYISFSINNILEDHLRKNHFSSINHFNAIDGRKMNAKQLWLDNMITIRSYNDLIEGRNEDSGLPTLGAVGCTLSHLALWNLCIKNNYPYMIILENDAYIAKQIDNKKQQEIRDSLTKPNGIWVSTHSIINKTAKVPFFYGLHFYIISNSAAKVFVKYALPIDVQTDAYLSHLMNMKKINIGFDNTIAKQYTHASDIQTTCVRCLLPKNLSTYFVIISIIISIIITVIIMIKLIKKCFNKK